MLETAVMPTTRTRLFLSVSIPPLVNKALEEAMRPYQPYIENEVTPVRRHLTLVFLGEVENPKQYYSRLLKDMPQTFVPTINLTHVGRGLHRMQLWAFGHPTNSLLNLREQVLMRLKKMRCPLPEDQADREFVPHIHIANLYAMSRSVGLADQPLSTQFTVPTIELYKSTRSPDGLTYHLEGAIGL